jgi:hypothetical protein
MKTAVTASSKSLVASIKVSYLIAKNKMPHTTRMTFLLPAAIEICFIMHSENYGQALKVVPLITQ